jgi:hypothetical protein
VEEGGGRLDHAAGSEEGLHEDGCHRVVEVGASVLEVAVSHKDGIAGLAREFGPGTVIAALEEKQAAAAGRPPRDSRGENRGLASRVREAHELDCRVARLEKFGPRELARMRSGKGAPPASGVGYRLDDWRVGVAVDERGVVVEDVEVAVSVHVDEEGAFAALEHDRVRLVERESARLAAGEAGAEALEAARRLLRSLPVLARDVDVVGSGDRHDAAEPSARHRSLPLATEEEAR